MTMSFLTDKRIVVTGGYGFLGREVCRELAAHQPATLAVPRRADFDLRDRDAIHDLVATHRPQIVVHLAAVGGSGADRAQPGRLFYENAVMGLELMEQSRLAGVEKFVVTGTIGSYPKFTPVPFREEELWNGFPAETSAPYGLAKKMLLVQAQAYRQQYGFNAITLLPVNLYGPGDNFDSATSHVIPALIRKVIEAQDAGHDEIEVWGTGRASREFLHVRDAARAIVLATEKYHAPEPVNIGSGREISIRALAELICELCGFEGRVVWDRTKPDGQPRRCLDTSRAAKAFGFRAETELRAGLLETIQWFRRQCGLGQRKAA